MKLKLTPSKNKEKDGKNHEYEPGIMIDDDEELMIIYAQEEYASGCASCPFRGFCGK